MFSFHTTHVIVLSNLCVLILGVGKPCKTLNTCVTYKKAISLERGDSDVRPFCAKPSHFSFSRLSHVLEHTWNFVLAEEKRNRRAGGGGAQEKHCVCGPTGLGLRERLSFRQKNMPPLKLCKNSLAEFEGSWIWG